VQKLDTYMRAVLLIFPSRDQSAMRSWQNVWLKSTAGFPTQAGSLSAFAVNDCHLTSVVDVYAWHHPSKLIFV
jgi:hypothetical protein